MSSLEGGLEHKVIELTELIMRTDYNLGIFVKEIVLIKEKNCRKWKNFV